MTLYLEREQPAVLPKSPEGAAISYTLSNWEARVRYCEDGDLEIDNDCAERSLRGIAVGRKNWTFLGSDEGGRTAAILTTLTTTCKRLGVDPFDYLRDILQRIRHIRKTAWTICSPINGNWLDRARSAETRRATPNTHVRELLL